jgi:hypothetical protein
VRLVVPSPLAAPHVLTDATARRLKVGPKGRQDRLAAFDDRLFVAALLGRKRRRRDKQHPHESKVHEAHSQPLPRRLRTVAGQARRLGRVVSSGSKKVVVQGLGRSRRLSLGRERNRSASSVRERGGRSIGRNERRGTALRRGRNRTNARRVRMRALTPPHKGTQPPRLRRRRARFFCREQGCGTHVEELGAARSTSATRSGVSIPA